MTPKVNKREESLRKKVTMVKKAIPVSESLLIRQRLRNLIELAVAIGQKEGLLGNHKETSTVDKEGGQNVANKRNIRDRKATPSGKDKAGGEERE
jgi:hypothetical protein